MGNATIYLRDVAHVRDGFAPQTNIVRRDGRRGTLMTILKTGGARRSTSCSGVSSMLPRVATHAAAGAEDPAARRPVGLRAGGGDRVIREAIIAACLTALMILLFLGSWRSTLIIAVSIPLSILTSIIVLSSSARRSTS